MTEELLPLPEDVATLDKAYPEMALSDQVKSYAHAAVLAERERCAKVCEAEAESLGSGGKKDAAALCCAAAIRAGTEPSCCAGGPQWGHAWDCPKCPG